MPPSQTLPSPRQCRAACSVATAKCGLNVASASPTSTTRPPQYTARSHTASLTRVTKTDSSRVVETSVARWAGIWDTVLASCALQREGETSPMGTVLVCVWPVRSVSSEVGLAELLYQTQLRRRVEGWKVPASGGMGYLGLGCWL